MASRRQSAADAYALSSGSGIFRAPRGSGGSSSSGRRTVSIGGKLRSLERLDIEAGTFDGHSESHGKGESGFASRFVSRCRHLICRGGARGRWIAVVTLQAVAIVALVIRGARENKGLGAMHR